MRVPLPICALAIVACNERTVSVSSGSTRDAGTAATLDAASSSDSGSGAHDEAERRRFSADCKRRGLGGMRLAACVDFQHTLSQPPECPPYPPPIILHYDMECPVLAEREVLRTGRMQANVLGPRSEIKSAVSRIFVEHRRPFLDCYSAGLRSDPSLAGTVHLDFAVDERGGLSIITARSRTIDDRFVLDCVVRVAASFRADVEPTEPVDVAADLTFTP